MSCGSTTGFIGPVERPSKIVISVHDLDGKKFEPEADGFLARLIQHEYDHLDSILYKGKLSDPKKFMSVEMCNEYHKPTKKLKT